MEFDSDRPVSVNDNDLHFPGNVSWSSGVILYLSNLMFCLFVHYGREGHRDGVAF
jgi:hypothetical protein